MHLARRIDVTCCDIEAATIGMDLASTIALSYLRLMFWMLARNILLLTLILDDKDGSRHSHLWNVYYHLYLHDATLELLKTQASKLCALAISMQSWHTGKYGRQLRFCDNSTRRKVREIWNTYGHLDSNTPNHGQWLRAEAAMQRAMNTRKSHMGKSGIALSGIRSAAPAGTRAAKDAPMLGQHYWDQWYD